MKRRLLIMALALILAALGTAGVVSYVRGANARAIAGMKAVSVLVAQKQIPAGTSASAALRGGQLTRETLPASSVPASALRSIPSSLSSLVLSADLPAGQLLLRPMLVTPAQTTSGLAIPPGMMALTISFCLPEDVAGAVQPGSLIAVFDTVGTGGGGQLTGVPGCTGAHTQVSGSNRTRVVLNRVLVLSVGASQASPAGASTSTTVLGGGGGSSSSSPSQGGTLVTVAVNQADAEKLIQLTETGMPYLALLTPGTHITADVGDLLSIRPPNPTIPRTTITLPIVTPTAAPAPAPAPPAPAPNPQPSPTPNHPK